MMPKIAGYWKVKSNNTKQNTTYKCFKVNGQRSFFENRFKEFDTKNKSPAKSCAYYGEENRITKIKKPRIFISRQIRNRPQPQKTNNGKHQETKTTGHKNGNNDLVIHESMLMG